VKTDSILFWPGRGKSPDVLTRFLSVLNTNAYTIVTIPFEYDTGIPPFTAHSEWETWCAENNFSWWIGISLGASLAYTFASLLNEANRPERLTLINPFASREILAKEKKFSINDQWNFSPIHYDLNLRKIDMVVSVFDKKIPIYHGISLLNKVVSSRKNLIFVDDNHQIQNEAAQKELAELLIVGKNTKREGNCGKTYYCNVYQQ
jgi:hypothetical protein